MLTKNSKNQNHLLSFFGNVVEIRVSQGFFVFFLTLWVLLLMLEGLLEQLLCISVSFALSTKDNLQLQYTPVLSNSLVPSLLALGKAINPARGSEIAPTALC